MGAMARPQYLLATYSIVAFDSETGQLGVAVQTHQPGVGWIVPWLEPGVGAVATQASVNFSFGPLGLSLLREGVAPDRVVASLASSDEGANRRQVGVVDCQGRASAFTGSGCIAEAGHHSGEGFSVQANMMAKPTVIDAMAGAFAESSGDLAHRMLAALEAAQAEEGDIRGMQSAALVVVPGSESSAYGVRSWERVYDLRVDESEEPLTELSRLVAVRAASLRDNDGHALLDAGDVDGALEVFREVRAAAPDQEELAFWQAVALLEADARGAKTVMAELRSALSEMELDRWIDLAGRLRDCGMIERDETVEAIQSGLRRGR
jgi:uncharacterized Ntn-hydrolase superfamily protein